MIHSTNYGFSICKTAQKSNKKVYYYFDLVCKCGAPHYINLQDLKPYINRLIQHNCHECYTTLPELTKKNGIIIVKNRPEIKFLNTENGFGECSNGTRFYNSIMKTKVNITRDEFLKNVKIRYTTKDIHTPKSDSLFYKNEKEVYWFENNDIKVFFA